MIVAPIETKKWFLFSPGLFSSRFPNINPTAIVVIHNVRKTITNKMVNSTVVF